MAVIWTLHGSRAWAAVRLFGLVLVLSTCILPEEPSAPGARLSFDINPDTFVIVLRDTSTSTSRYSPTAGL